jgi:hypothetical protein
LDPLAVDVDGLARVDPDPELGDQVAVDLDPAGGDEVLAGPPRADSGGGEQLLQAYAVGVVDVDRRLGRAALGQSRRL